MKAVTWCIGFGLAALAAQGCMAETVANSATPPVKAASGKERELRKREEQLEKLRRTYVKQLAKCQDGYENACYDARITEGEIQNILASLPARPG